MRRTLPLLGAKRSGSSHEWLKRQNSDVYVRAAQLGNYRARSFAKLQELQERYRLLSPGALVLELGAAPGGWSQVAAEIVHGGGTSALMLPSPPVIFLERDAALSPAPPARAAGGRASILMLGHTEPGALPAPAPAPSPSPAPLARPPLLQQAPPPPPLVVALDLLPIDPIPGVQMVRGNALRADLLPLLRRSVLQGHRGRSPSVLLCDMAPSFTGEAGTDQLRQIALALAALRIALDGGLAPGGNLCLKARYGEGYAELRASLRARFRAVHEAKPPASRAQSAEAYLVGLGFTPLPWLPAEAAYLASLGL